MNIQFENFTINNYYKLLNIAKTNFSFTLYDNIDWNKRFLLWRHDIDISPHRALKLATIESEKNIRATYFVWLHSPMYHFYEKEVAKILIKILDLGHDIGLHFDTGYYGLLNETQLEEQIKQEQAILEKVIGKRIASFSYHNPGVGLIKNNDFSINELIVSTPYYFKSSICGLINTYGEKFRDDIYYCSDSNGYWRFKNLQDVLESSKSEIKRLHVLTHPEWWVPEPMSPRDRIQRCIDGRAKKNSVWYDNLLKNMGRKNIK